MSKANEIIDRVTKLGGGIGANELADYFTGVTEEDVATQRSAKAKFSEVLRSSSDRPQIITLRKNGNNVGGNYVILPLRALEDIVEARKNEDRETFVPITKMLRDGDGMGGLALPKKVRANSRGRSSRKPVQRTLSAAGK